MESTTLRAEGHTTAKQLAEQEQPHSTNAKRGINVGEAERWASALTGGLLLFHGLRKKSLGGLATAAAGGSLLYRGITGHCDLYAALGINTACSHKIHPANRSLHVEKSIVVNKPIH